jgi:hypothetical protein
MISDRIIGVKSSVMDCEETIVSKGKCALSIKCKQNRASMIDCKNCQEGLQTG